MNCNSQGDFLAWSQMEPEDEFQREEQERSCEKFHNLLEMSWLQEWVKSQAK